MGGGFGGGADAFSDIFGDVFGDIFGGGRRGGRSQVFRGADLRYELELTLEQAVAGDSVTLDIPAQVECTRCTGKGAEPGSQPITCKTCGGVGPGARRAGVLLDPADLPELRRRRRDDRQAVPRLQRPRPRAQEQDAVGQGAGRRRQRRPDPLGARGRGGPQRRAAGRPLRRHHAFKRTRSSRAKART